MEINRYNNGYKTLDILSIQGKDYKVIINEKYSQLIGKYNKPSDEVDPYNKDNFFDKTTTNLVLYQSTDKKNNLDNINPIKSFYIK